MSEEEKAQLLLHKESVSTYDADSIHNQSDTELEVVEDYLDDVLPQAPRKIPCTEIPPPNTFRDSGYVNVVSTYIVDAPEEPEELLPPSPDLVPLIPDPTTIELAGLTLLSQKSTGRPSSKKTSTSRSQNSTPRSQGATSRSQDTASSGQDSSVNNTTMNTNPHAEFAAMQGSDVPARDPVPGKGEEEQLSLVPIAAPPEPAQPAPLTLAPRLQPLSHLHLAICAAVLCLPLGLVAVVKARQVGKLYNKGEAENALYASRKARRWSIISIIVGVASIVLCIIIIIVAVGAVVATQL